MDIGDIFYSLKNHEKPYKCYVVAIVDDDYIVYKWYGRHKQYWHYEVKHIDFVEIEIERASRY